MKKQMGFTLIELVIVVVILGFLAATAIPKFLDLSEQAKQANIEGMAGGFATGISLTRAQWEAEGRPKTAANKNTVNYDGTTLFLTVENTGTGIRPGYPVGLDDNGDDLSALNGDDCLAIWNNILQQPPATTNVIGDVNDNSIDYFASKSGAGAATRCHFYLKETLNRDNAGNFANPNSDTSIGNSFTYQPATSSVVVHINN